MGFAPRILVFALSLLVAPASFQATDLFHDKIDAVAAKFSSLNIPNLEKIQLPQSQPDGSVIFLYIWLPETHRPTMASFEANIGEYFDIVGSRSASYAGCVYLRKPETHVLKGGDSQVAAMRISALAYHGRAPRDKCHGKMPGAAGQLGHTQIVKDPNSGLLSMVRSGYPTEFPSAKRMQ